MATLINKIHKVTYEGTCPGGTWYDNMGKAIPCPQKSYKLDSEHPFIVNQRNFKTPIINCSRCGSEIELSPITEETGYKIISLGDY